MGSVQMKIGKIGFFWWLLFTMFSSASIFAQANATGWNAVESLAAGKRIFVETKAGETLVAKLASSDATSITLRHSGRSVRLGRDDVARIFTAARKSRIKRAFWGAAAGGGIGIALGIGLGIATKEPLLGAGGVLIGFPAGAAIGAATTGHKRGKLIYSSP